MNPRLRIWHLKLWVLWQNLMERRYEYEATVATLAWATAHPGCWRKEDGKLILYYDRPLGWVLRKVGLRK